MGMIGMTMPLLSTLAALVIIVHSAEEEASRALKPEYRYETAPEIIDTGTGTLERRWRPPRTGQWVPHVHRINQESTPMDKAQATRDRGQGTSAPAAPEQVKRRRRRKRPRMSAWVDFQDELEQPSNDFMHDALPQFHDYGEQLQRSIDARKGRRKLMRKHTTQAIATTTITDTTTTEGERVRDRLAEFDEFTPGPEETTPLYDLEEKLNAYKVIGKHHKPDTILAPTATPPYDLEKKLYSYEVIGNRDESDNDPTLHLYEPSSNRQGKGKMVRKYFRHHRDLADENNGTLIVGAHYPPVRKNSSHHKREQKLAEFSAEFTDPAVSQEEHKSRAKPAGSDGKLTSGLHTKQLPLNPVSLKDILKRSNGTSLSEILQQHNLSLSDLLNGSEDALSVLKTDKLSEKQHHSVEENLFIVVNESEKSQHKEQSNPHNNFDGTIHENISKDIDLESQSTGRDRKPQGGSNGGENENKTKTTPAKRFNGRRKLRLRTTPMNNMQKSPLSRDFMANSARKYHNNRNMTKSKQWKYVLPMMISTDSSEETYIISESNEALELLSTTTSAPEEETTILPNSEYYNPTTVVIQLEDNQTAATKPDNEIQNETETTATVPVTQIFETTTTEKPKVPRLRPLEGRMGLRRQSYNNRMKRKRMKQRISTTEAPPDGFFGVPNMVSSSEFIAQTQPPQNRNPGNEEDDFTTLEDFFTTEKAKLPEIGQRYTRNSTVPSVETRLPTRAPIPFRFASTTEETAKFEIEEILNDTRTSARLSKILMERNMTLNELVEHRERGSSHVHLADIFHNASKEPNPPEPFLSKSSIEPISKETYPLRAILEANLHEAAPKANKVDTSNDQPEFVNIPIAMNFGNNVNENGENMGIMTLFNNMAGHDDVTSVENTSTGKDSEGTPYITTIFAVNHTANNDTALEGKAMKNEENNFKDDVMGWNQLFKLIKRTQKNSSDENEAIIKDAMLETENQELVEGLDDDGLMAYEDLQRLKDFDITVGSDEKISIDAREELGILDPHPNRAKSVTVATASIVGLAMILFLLTYALLKWKQQRGMLRNKQIMYPDEKIPTPVFENRKGHKNNSSTRSISPMLNSNIYTLSTLDSRNGKESPDYMWDSLRKPFQ